MSNAPGETPLSQLAVWRSQRYFAERIYQDAKSEAGWDELIARKYRAWIHHTALDALALWFVAEIKLEWAQAYPRAPTLAEQLELEVLPALSMANVRELLRAVLPLRQLSQEQAIRLVVKHLVNRSRSTSSRLKAQRRNRSPTWNLTIWTLAKMDSLSTGRLLSRIGEKAVLPVPTGGHPMFIRILHNSEKLCTFLDQLDVELSQPQRRHILNMADALFGLRRQEDLGCLTTAACRSARCFQ